MPKEGARGPLHGIPILLKDNIATSDRMSTTAGSFALVGTRPEEAFVVNFQLYTHKYSANLNTKPGGNVNQKNHLS
jgi:hypothetical protein